MSKNQDTEKEPNETEENDEKSSGMIIEPEPNSRIVGLYGSIDEEKSASMISVLYHMKSTGKIVAENGDISYDPIEFLISTDGGIIADTFAMYDVMRDDQKECPISTFGVGKVMSAGLILLAAGTPGKRRIGKHCRLMIHQISSGNYGQLHDLQNNVDEIKWMQKMYVDTLANLTKLSKKEIEKLFKKRMDIYFDSETAVKWGIADCIV